MKKQYTYPQMEEVKLLETVIIALSTNDDEDERGPQSAKGRNENDEDFWYVPETESDYSLW